MQKIMWKPCGKYYNKKKPDDFVICTGRQYTIKEFINLTGRQLGIKITWRGKGIKKRLRSK